MTDRPSHYDDYTESYAGLPVALAPLPEVQEMPAGAVAWHLHGPGMLLVHEPPTRLRPDDPGRGLFRNGHDQDVILPVHRPTFIVGG